jgi:hypothetical protein
MNRRIVAMVLVAGLAATAAVPAFAGKGGNGKGNGNGNVVAAASCTIDGNVVTGSGLPVWELLNFMVKDASGSIGWVLGYTDTGSLAVTVPARSGATTYEFVSRTWGPEGSRYTVYATCSA